MVTAAEHTSWQEEHVRGERGREVRYYLMRRDGAADLAVVGRERGMRHMVYQVMIRDRDVISPSTPGKLRTRREVVDWLDSMVSGFSGHSSQLSPLVKDACKLDIETLKDNQPRKPMAVSVWVGTPWMCKKRRMHYPMFLRNGVKISVNDFVFVLAEENKRLVAHLDDLYEDSRGNKMVVVQWFHKIDEVGFVLPHNFNDKEIFFSQCLQDLSIECIDGLATVLSPQHFQKHLSHTQARPAQMELFVCQSLFDNDEIKPFDVTQIKGYWKQAILKQNSASVAPLKAHVKNFSSEGVVTRPKKRLRHSIEPEQYVSKNLVVPKVEVDISKNSVTEKAEKSTQNMSVGSRIEVLSQDSGLRGCWFRAMIVKKHKDKVKVQYSDLKDAENEAKNLQEWLPASRIALHDPLGLRLSGRRTIRPNPNSEKEKLSLLLGPGTVVDVWWYDGWWEGILLHKEKEDKFRVYFPGEKQASTFAFGDLRLSKEWVGNKWVSFKERPNLVASIISNLNEQKVSEMRISKNDKSMVDGGDRLVGDTHKEHGVVEEDVVCKKPRVSKDDIFDRLRWRSSKRRTPCITNKRKKSPENKATRVSDFYPPSSLKVDQDNCKYIFSSSVSSLTNLVMSR